MPSSALATVKEMTENRKNRLMSFLLFIGSLLVVGAFIANWHKHGIGSSLATAATPTQTASFTPTLPVVTPTAMVVGKTPVIGYMLVCTDGSVTWTKTALANGSDPNDWPPKEQC